VPAAGPPRTAGKKKHCQEPLLREKLRELAADVEKRFLTPLERFTFGAFNQRLLSRSPHFLGKNDN